MSNVKPIELREEAQGPARLDQVSLEQALKDFEIANSRVLDLTQRLVESERQRQAAVSELELLRLRFASSQVGAALRSPPRAWEAGVMTLKKVATKVYARYRK